LAGTIPVIKDVTRNAAAAGGPGGRGREDTAMRIARITRRVASVVGEMNYAQRRLVAVLMGCKDS